MRNTIPPVLLTAVLFLSTQGFAQTPPVAPSNPAMPSDEAPALPNDAPSAPAPVGVVAGGVPDVGQAAAAAPAAPVDSGSAVVEDRLTNVEGKVAGVEESLAETKSTVGKLSKIKVSGYIQGRYEYHGDSVDGVTSAGKPATTSQFLVRRGRLKTIYEGTNAEYMLQIDAVPSGVTLKDAEATFVDTWSPFGFRLTVGMFKWPFGYEILQSSGDREMPERSLMIRRLFPGERDRGVRLQAKYEWLRFSAALVNGVREVPTGSATQDAIYTANDQNAFKDLVGRIGGDFEFLVVGLSGYYGHILKTTLPTTLSPKWTDANMDKMVTLDEVTFVPPAAAAYQRFSRTRLGLDAQFYVDVPSIGGLALKGEFIYAKDGNLDYMGTAANSCKDVTSLGWILTAVQNIGDYMGAVVRVDSYDGNFSKALASRCTAEIAAGEGDRVDTYAGGLLFHGSGNVKATVTYEHVAEQNKTVENDVFTAQLQARF